MAEEKYLIPASPQYSENIRKLQDSDPASASTVFNPLFARLIENTAAVKRMVEHSVAQLELTIPAAGWTVDAAGPYNLRLDVAVAGVTDRIIPKLIIPVACEETAADCGLSSVVETVEGAVRLRAMAAPAADITASLVLLCSSTEVIGSVQGSGAIAAMPLATENTPGAVKPGRGLMVAEDGTLSVDMASDEEFEALLGAAGEGA